MVDVEDTSLEWTTYFDDQCTDAISTVNAFYDGQCTLGNSLTQFTVVDSGEQDDTTDNGMSCMSMWDCILLCTFNFNRL